MPDLCVNIDHVATVRQARRTYEPDPLMAAADAALGGADGITVHLREDRRHIQDDDVHRLKAALRIRFNLEMAAVDEMVSLACAIKPHSAMLVPERRLEVTTEGGLDVASQLTRIRDVARRLNDHGIPVSVFIDAIPRQVEAAAAAGASVCELHTGPYAHAFHDHGGERSAEAAAELARLVTAGTLVRSAGMQLNAGHALNYENVRPVAAIEGVRELHIGHSIVSRAIFTGIRRAVSDMKALLSPSPARAASPASLSEKKS